MYDEYLGFEQVNIILMNQTKVTQKILLFTDAATSPQNKIAIGAFCFFTEIQMKEHNKKNKETLFKTLADAIIYKEYPSKKSTWSEIKTVIDALSIIQKNHPSVSQIEIYTDCQSLCDLLGKRKEKLKKNHFKTRTGKLLANASLYQELFTMTETFSIQLVKIKGHTATSLQITLPEKIFGILDSLSRKKLRSIVKHQ